MKQDISGDGLADPTDHAPGLFYLLEMRGPEQIGTRRGAELFLLALLRLVCDICFYMTISLSSDLPLLSAANLLFFQ